MKNPIKTIRVVSLLIWIFAIISFIATLTIGTNRFSASVIDTNFGKSSLFTYLLYGSVIVGIMSFLIAICAKPIFWIFQLIKSNVKNSLMVGLLLILGGTILYYYLKANSISLTQKNGTYKPSFLQNSEPRISSDHIYTLVNDERVKANLKPLKINEKLVEAAQLRAKDILSTGDWSHEAPHSGNTYTKVMTQVKYDNSKKGENLAKDYRDDNSIVVAWMNSPEHKENIVDPLYQETGVATASGTMSGIKTVVVVQLFGGYVPPNYSKEVIESWEKSLTSLQGILPSWENTRNSPNLYPNNKDKCERIIAIIQTRINKTQQVVSLMHANKYLGSDLDKYTNSGDTTLSNEQESIAKYLNSQKW